jgi:hypothetical protein
MGKKVDIDERVAERIARATYAYGGTSRMRDEDAPELLLWLRSVQPTTALFYGAYDTGSASPTKCASLRVSRMPAVHPKVGGDHYNLRVNVFPRGGGVSTVLYVRTGVASKDSEILNAFSPTQERAIEVIMKALAIIAGGEV